LAVPGQADMLDHAIASFCSMLWICKEQGHSKKAGKILKTGKTSTVGTEVLCKQSGNLQ
jgi:hypothetical protein